MSDKTDTSGANSHVREMSVTERLRALLDERGVEWTGSDTRTDFIVDGIDWEAYEHVVFGEPSGLLSVMTALTPEQAIDATLGRGTCHFEQIPEALYDDIECSECGVALWGFQMDIAGEGCPTKPRYCPNCGRAVVNEVWATVAG